MKFGELGNGIWFSGIEREMLRNHGGPVPFEVLRDDTPDAKVVSVVYELLDADLLFAAAQRAQVQLAGTLYPNAAELNSHDESIKQAAAEKLRLAVLNDTNSSRAFLMRDLIAAGQIIDQLQDPT